MSKRTSKTPYSPYPYPSQNQAIYKKQSSSRYCPSTNVSDIRSHTLLKYVEAMQSALGDGDLTKIKQFYHYKICDSIISLDTHLEDKIDFLILSSFSQRASLFG